MMGVRKLTQGREALTTPLDDLPVAIPFRGLAGARGVGGAGGGGGLRMAEGEEVEMTESMEEEAGEEYLEVSMLDSMEVSEIPEREREQRGKRKQEGVGRAAAEIKRVQKTKGEEASYVQLDEMESAMDTQSAREDASLLMNL